jgi:GNAT superfamily N-acetyltransferase
MEIIPAIAADHAALTALTKSSKAYWGYPEAVLKSWEALLTLSPEYITTNEVFKLLHEDRIIGYYAYFFTDEHTIILDNMFLLPEFIGQGFGKVLMNDFLQKAGQAGIHRITLDAEPHAEAFYKACGFKTIGQFESSIKDRYLPIMELKIAR